MQDIPLSTLTVRRRLREGYKDKRIRLTKREFSDFLIDGKSLLDMVGGDYTSCFIRGLRKHNIGARERLLEASSASPVSLYICPQCGDIECGAIQTRVARREGDVVWETLHWDNALSDPIYDEMREGFAEKKLGPFRFQAEAYAAAILEASRI